MKKYKLETINCPLCNSNQYTSYINGAKELYNDLDEYFNVCKCSSCSHCFTNPRPTIDTISYFYPDSAGYYKPVKYKQSTSYKSEVYKQILNMFYNYNLPSKANKFISIVVFILRRHSFDTTHIPQFRENGKLLDIGCSYGNYLKHKEDLGWEVYGIELNQNAVKYAQEELGLCNIKSGFFENIDFEDEYFDVVNMNMVLEHIYNPNNIIRKINKILKKDSQLILSIPDISGFEATLYKQYAYTLQVPEHIHHFTPQTITNLLKNNGFEVEKIVHQNFDRDLVASAGYMPNKILSNFLKNKFIRKTFVKFFVWFLSYIGKTSRMSVYARKI